MDIEPETHSKRSGSREGKGASQEFFGEPVLIAFGSD